jgi:hypothetical protein
MRAQQGTRHDALLWDAVLVGVHECQRALRCSCGLRSEQVQELQHWVGQLCWIV